MGWKSRNLVHLRMGAHSIPSYAPSPSDHFVPRLRPDRTPVVRNLFCSKLVLGPRLLVLFLLHHPCSRQALAHTIFACNLSLANAIADAEFLLHLAPTPRKFHLSGRNGRFFSFREVTVPLGVWYAIHDQITRTYRITRLHQVWAPVGLPIIFLRRRRTNGEIRWCFSSRC